jgi:hypothetical protein
MAKQKSATLKTSMQKSQNSQQSLTQAWFDGALMETSNKQKESVEQGSIPISNAYPTFKNW